MEYDRRPRTRNRTSQYLESVVAQIRLSNNRDSYRINICSMRRQCWNYWNISDSLSNKRSSLFIHSLSFSDTKITINTYLKSEGKKARRLWKWMKEGNFAGEGKITDSVIINTANVKNSPATRAENARYHLAHGLLRNELARRTLASPLYVKKPIYSFR